MVSSPADSCQAHTCTHTNTHTQTRTHTHTARIVHQQSSISVRAQFAMLAATPHSRVTTHAAEDEDKNDEDLCVVERPLTKLCVVVIIAALVVVIEIADWCFGGLGCWCSSARRAGDDDGHGDDAPANGGGVCWAALADGRLDAARELSCFRTLASLAGV